MKDVSFLSMLGMIAMGLWIGRGSRPINKDLMTWVFGVFMCFYIFVGLVFIR